MTFNCSDVLLLAQCTLKLNWMASRMLQHCQIPKKHRRIEFYVWNLFVSVGGVERMTLDDIRVSRVNDEINETIIFNRSRSSSNIFFQHQGWIFFIILYYVTVKRESEGRILPVKDMTCSTIWAHKQDEHPWSSWQ